MLDLKLIDKELKKLLPKDNLSLSKAIRYSMFAGGKRIRPILCLEAGLVCGAKIKDLISVACSLEMIHTFTLIHDDLPAMDNSDLRRGKPTCHKVFGEDIAVLAGDALNSLAFEVIAKYAPTNKAASIISELAKGSVKVVKGQVLDLEAEGKKLTYEKLREIHLLKTAALIESSVKMGAICAGASKKQISALVIYAQNLGLAFQITDDILDVISSSKVLGKPSGSDERHKKATYPSLLGMEKAKLLAEKHINLAKKSLHGFGNKSQNLLELADLVIHRNK